MAKTTRALSGSHKDAFFRDLLLEEQEIESGARDRLFGRLQKGVSHVRIRLTEAALRVNLECAVGGEAEICEAAEPEAAESEAPGFDPFTPNVVVLVRREGREAALSALKLVGSQENLKLLAREQQLSIGDEARSIDEIALAIVHAAERRIANRRAAAR